MVEEKIERLSRRDMAGAKEARRALEMFGYPSQKTSEHMVCTINNIPVIIEDDCNAKTVYSCNVTPLKVKTVRQQPKRGQE